MWKYLIRESPEIQSRSLLQLSISSSVPCALLLLCALKTSLNKCFLPVSWQGSCTLPRQAVFMVLSTFQNGVSRFFNTRNHFAFLGCMDREGAHAARRSGDRDAAKGPVPQTCFYMGMGTPIHPYKFTYLGPVMGVPPHSPWYEASPSGIRESPVLT